MMRALLAWLLLCGVAQAQTAVNNLPLASTVVGSDALLMTNSASVGHTARATVSTVVGSVAPLLSGGTLTGPLFGPTAACGSTTQFATLAYVATCGTGGLTSFNGRTGPAITLQSADVTAALTFTPNTPAFDAATYLALGGGTMTGAITAPGMTDSSLLSAACVGTNGSGLLIAVSCGTGGGGITALTGDGTASGTGSVALTLATVNGNVGTCGSASAIPSVTLDAKGRATGCTTTAPALATASTAGTVIVGTGLNVSAGTISENYGTAAGTTAQGNDSRITGALSASTAAATYLPLTGGTLSNTLTVSAGGVAVTGNSTVAGTLTTTGTPSSIVSGGQVSATYAYIHLGDNKVVATNGGSATIPNSSDVYELDPAATISTFTLTLMATAVSHQRLDIFCGQTITTLSLVAPAAQTIRPGTTAGNTVTYTCGPTQTGGIHLQNVGQVWFPG